MEREKMRAAREMQITIGFEAALAIAIPVSGAIITAIVYIIRLEGRIKAFELVIAEKFRAAKETSDRHERALEGVQKMRQIVGGRAHVFQDGDS